MIIVAIRDLTCEELELGLRVRGSYVPQSDPLGLPREEQVVPRQLDARNVVFGRPTASDLRAASTNFLLPPLQLQFHQWLGGNRVRYGHEGVGIRNGHDHP